jgi:hypothetical protein
MYPALNNEETAPVHALKCRVGYMNPAVIARFFTGT